MKRSPVCGGNDSTLLLFYSPEDPPTSGVNQVFVTGNVVTWLSLPTLL